MLDARIHEFVNKHFVSYVAKEEVHRLIKDFILAHLSKSEMPTPELHTPERALLELFIETVLAKLELKTGWGRNELKDILADTYTIVVGESPGMAEDDPIV